MKSVPQLSVVMPAYNAATYIREAIESILSQTFADFELIIVNDGSTDKTESIINAFKDKRIRLITQKNSGVSASRNKAIKLARGKFIAMHDSDDISYPDRFEVQLNFLREHPDVGLIGSTLEAIDSDGSFMYYINLLTHPDDLKLAEIFSNQIGQGAVMLRAEILKKSGTYNMKMKYSEDTDLWRRMLHHTKLANIKRPLYKYRVHEAGASQNVEKIIEMAFTTRDREFDYYIRNKDEYKFFSFHPFSMHGGFKQYLERKSNIYSRMSLMFCKKGLRRKAFIPLIVSIGHAPWMTKLYIQLWLTMTSRQKILSYKYELF